MKTLTLALIATGLLLGTTACGQTAAEPSPSPSPSVAVETTPTPSPTQTETYGECVSGIPMDPTDVQHYIDQVNQECGQLPGAPRS